MSEVASRELRNDTRGVLRRVESGERVVITVDGRAVARLQPLDERAAWMPRHRFLALIDSQADAGMTAELAELAPDTTDDLRD